MNLKNLGVMLKMIDNDYGMARENARQILLYAWRVFDEKTNKISMNLSTKPLSEAVPIGSNSTQIDIQKIIPKLEQAKHGLDKEITKVIEKEFFNKKNDTFNEDDSEWIEKRVNEAKKIGINWFQSFVIKSGIANRLLENIMFLWKNFCTQNLWIRYNKEPVFRDCKDKGEITKWMETNNNHLISCYHEAIFSIVKMRNISEHFSTNHYAKEFLKKLDDPIRDPLTDLDDSLFNSYTYFTSMTNMITGMLRSLQIFEESIIISLKDGVEESEYPPKIEYSIECPKCNTIFLMPFDPDEGFRINCNSCREKFSYRPEYAR